MKLTDFITLTEPMKHWREYWTAQLGDTKATGKSKEEATKNLFQTIRQSLDGSFVPVMLFHYGRIALIWREGQQWYYTVREVGESGPVHTNIHCIGDRQQTEIYARNHLAQYALEMVKHPEEAAEIIIDEQERGRFIAAEYRSREIRQIMQERSVDLYRASMIFDGLAS